MRKSVEHISFRLDKENLDDKVLKTKLESIKKEYKISFNEIIKLGINQVYNAKTKLLKKE